MRKGRKGAAAPPPARLYSLTQDQAEFLQAAADQAPRGAYVPLTGGRVASELVTGGAAEFREEPQSSGTRGPNDPRPCQWTDYYLVPTQHGLDLLKKASGAS